MSTVRKVYDDRHPTTQSLIDDGTIQVRPSRDGGVVASVRDCEGLLPRGSEQTGDRHRDDRHRDDARRRRADRRARMHRALDRALDDEEQEEVEHERPLKEGREDRRRDEVNSVGMNYSDLPREDHHRDRRPARDAAASVHNGASGRLSSRPDILKAYDEVDKQAREEQQRLLRR